MITAVTALDTSILMWIQENLRTPALTWLFCALSLITTFGAVWIAVGLALLIIKKTRKAGLFTLVCLAFEYIINDLVLKGLIARVRPYEVIDGLALLVPPESSFSMPSGHAAVSFAAALAITLSCGKKGAWAYLPAALIAFSRIYVGVHYPSDVLAGMIVGTLAALIVYLVVRFAMKKSFPLTARG